MKDKAAPEKLQGYWILELGELAGLKKMDVETVKAFITRQDDKFRHSYGYSVEDHPRQCIIVGSTNNGDGFLRDVTGNRRFWPVTCTTNSPHHPWEVERVVPQLWAEAYTLYRAGEKLFLSPEEEKQASMEQTAALESDVREGMIAEYLDKLLPEDWDRMDSLYKGFPVGYIIVWKNPDIRLKDGKVSSGKKILIDGQQRMPCRSDGSQGSNDMDIESDDIEVSDSVTVLWEVR